MKKLFLRYFLFFFMFSISAMSKTEARKNESVEILGFWKTINEKTLQPECVIAIYPYQGQYFGRIILTYYDDGTVQDTIYNPKKRALGVKGNPYYVGLDIIWGLKDQGNKYKGGSILDPEKGRIYGAEAWRKAEKLVVRGKLLIFGRNQTWPRAEERDFPENFQMPDLSTFVPSIPNTI